MQLFNKVVNLDIRCFFFWWGSELAFLVPEKCRQFFSEKYDTVILTVLENSYEIARYNDGQIRVIADLKRNEQGQAVFKKLLETEICITKVDFIIRLTTKNAIKKEIYLPEAAVDDLYQVMLFELDRYTPFKPEQVYFSVKSMGQLDSGLVKVILILTPREEMDLILKELSRWGIFPKQVDFAGEPNSFKYREPTYNLLRDELTVTGDRQHRLYSWGLAALTTLLLMAVLAFPVYLQSLQVETLKAQLEPLLKKTLWVENQQSEIDSIYDKTVRLMDKKKNTPSVLHLINTLSGLLNDDTWLTHLQLKAGRLQIQGESPVASTLIGILESSPRFNNARFVSPLTQDKKTGMERFQVSFEWTQPKDAEDE